MPFIGNKVADVAVTVGQGVIDASHIQDASITTADIGNDAITPNKVDDDGTGFQMGSLGLGTAVSGSHKLTVGGTATFSGNITGTLATAAQTNITSVGTLTTLTVDDITLNDSTISDAADLTFDIGGDIILDADDEHIWLKDGGTTIGNIDLGSQNITIRNSVSNADLIFRGNDGGTEVEAMRINYSGNNVGIGTSSIGAKLHIADNRSTAYSSTGEPAETIIAHNKNGTDNSGVNNYASLSFQVADGATSQGFLNYVRTGNNTGEFTFSQRTGSSSYAEHLKIENDGTVVIPGAIQSTGNVSITSTVKYFQVMSHTDTSKVTKHAYDGLYTSGSQNQFIQSGQAIKFYPNATLNMQMSAGGSFQVGAGAIGTTNADNWKIVSKTTTGGTIDSTDGAGYFALGDNYTTSGGILMVRNDGNRGSRRHASGSSLFKAAFNDVTAFEIKKSGEIHGGYGCPVGFTGNWEVIDVISTGSSTGSLSSNNCFNDQTYSHFKIIIPYYRPTDNATDILFSFLYNTGGGLNEHVGDYYGHKQSMAHTNSGYLGGTYTNANRMTIFSGASNSTHAPTHGEITVFNVNTGDTRNFDTGKFTAHDYTGDGDTGSTYRPIGYFDMVGYNDTSDYYSRDTGMFRCNTSRHASYWKGFRIQQNTGNIAANTKIIILGMKL